MFNVGCYGWRSQDWKTQTVAMLVNQLCGFITIISGVYLLHTSKDMDPISGAEIKKLEKDGFFMKSGSARISEDIPRSDLPSKTAGKSMV